MKEITKEKVMVLEGKKFMVNYTVFYNFDNNYGANIDGLLGTEKLFMEGMRVNEIVGLDAPANKENIEDITSQLLREES